MGLQHRLPLARSAPVLCWAPLRPRLRACPVLTGLHAPCLHDTSAHTHRPASCARQRHAWRGSAPLQRLPPCTPATPLLRRATVGTVPLLPRRTATRSTCPTDALREPPPPAPGGNTCWVGHRLRTRKGHQRLPPAPARRAAYGPAAHDRRPGVDGGRRGRLRGAVLACASAAGRTATRQDHTVTDTSGLPCRATPAAGEVCAVGRRQDEVRPPACRARRPPVAHGMPHRGVPHPHGQAQA